MALTQQLIQRMLDREAIRELPIRYCHSIWTGDLEALVALFAADGSMGAQGTPNQKMPPGASGTVALREYFTATFNGPTVPRPYIHNHLVELTGPDSAIGWVYIELRSGKGAMPQVATGFYRDEYVKVGQEWKFRSRRASLASVAPVPG